MSQALVAHLILHPKISQSLKVLATTVGRDKVRQRLRLANHMYQRITLILIVFAVPCYRSIDWFSMSLD